jgi:hypothetical protein
MFILNGIASDWGVTPGASGKDRVGGDHLPAGLIRLDRTSAATR